MEAQRLISFHKSANRIIQHVRPIFNKFHIDNEFNPSFYSHINENYPVLLTIKYTQQCTTTGTTWIVFEMNNHIINITCKVGPYTLEPASNMLCYVSNSHNSTLRITVARIRICKQQKYSLSPMCKSIIMFATHT